MAAWSQHCTKIVMGIDSKLNKTWFLLSSSWQPSRCIKQNKAKQHAMIEENLEFRGNTKKWMLHLILVGEVGVSRAFVGDIHSSLSLKWWDRVSQKKGVREADEGIPHSDSFLAKALIPETVRWGRDLKLLTVKGEERVLGDKGGVVWFLFCGWEDANTQKKNGHSFFLYQQQRH